MKITILAVGKLKEKYWKQAIAEYEKRLGPYTKIDIIEVPDEKAPENMSDKEIEQVKKRRPTNTSQNQTTIHSHYIRNTRKDAIFRRIGPRIEPTHDPRAKRLCFRHWRIKRPAQGRLTTQ